MQVSTLFVLFAFVAAAFGQALFQVTYTSLNIVVGTKSDWFFVTAPVAPNNTVHVAISESTGNVELETPSLAFTPNVQQLSFRFTPKVVGAFAIEFSVDSTDFTITSSITISSNARPITLDATFPSYIYADLLTEPIKVYVKNSYGSAISLTPSLTSYPDGNAVPVSIVPSTITIPANSLSASFVLKASTPYTGIVQLQWGTISGDADNYYAIADPTPFYLTVADRYQPISPAFSTNAIVGAESTLLYFYTYGDRPNDTLTITPQAADSSFSPASITLDANTQIAQFTVTTTSTEGTKPIFFYSSNTASGYFEQVGTSSINVNKRFFTIDTPTTFAVTKPSTLSIKIEYPVVQDLTVQFYAANLIFEPTSVTFSGATTAADVKITPVYLGSDRISFQVTGSDAPYYTTPSDISVGIEGGSIIATADWCTPFQSGDDCFPTLWVGKESEKFAVRLNFPPATGLLVTPMAPDMIFNPTNLTFTPDSVEQWFTMTPVLAGTNNAAARTVSVSFAVSGDDWAWFDAPSDTTTFKVLQRNLQTAWSSQLTKSSSAQLNETGSILYSGTDYTVWVTASYVGSSDSFTVTPVSNYFKFNPQTLTFNSGSTRVSFTATPIAAIDTATINYVISGDSAGYYTSIPAESWNILLRPLYFYSAVVGRDDRVDAWRYVNASNYGSLTAGHQYIPEALALNHVNSFSIATPAFPTSKVTITPHSPHISFSPSSVTLTGSSSTTVWTQYSVSLPGATAIYTNPNGWEPTYLAIANFTLNGAAPGLHEVWFEVSSDDANYYAPPPHVWVTVRHYSGPGSASSTVVASIGMIVASVVLALFL